MGKAEFESTITDWETVRDDPLVANQPTKYQPE
jgi:hypothetical protein